MYRLLTDSILDTLMTESMHWKIVVLFFCWETKISVTRYVWYCRRLQSHKRPWSIDQSSFIHSRTHEIDTLWLRIFSSFFYVLRESHSATEVLNIELFLLILKFKLLDQYCKVYKLVLNTWRLKPPSRLFGQWVWISLKIHFYTH